MTERPGSFASSSSSPDPHTSGSCKRPRSSHAAPIRVLIVGAIRLYREGLAQVLGRREGFSVVGTATNHNEVLAKIQELAPEVILMDMATPDSHETARAIVRLTAACRIVALGVTEVEADVLACAEAGIAGYVPKEGSLSDLVTTVERAARGEVQCTPQLVATLWRRVATLAANQQPELSQTDLTRREREIVRLIDRELSNKEIAKHLGVEVATVKNHVHNLLEKLGVHRRTHAARLLRKSSAMQSAPIAQS